MLILGLLGMYFDAAVVFVTKSSLFFQIGCGHTVSRKIWTLAIQNFTNNLAIQNAVFHWPTSTTHFKDELIISETNKTQQRRRRWGAGGGASALPPKKIWDIS